MQFYGGLRHTKPVCLSRDAPRRIPLPFMREDARHLYSNDQYPAYNLVRDAAAMSTCVPTQKLSDYTLSSVMVGNDLENAA